MHPSCNLHISFINIVHCLDACVPRRAICNGRSDSNIPKQKGLLRSLCGTTRAKLSAARYTLFEIYLGLQCPPSLLALRLIPTLSIDETSQSG